MELEYIEDGTVDIHLSPEEMDNLLDPYDPKDRDITPYLHTRKHRFIKEDVYEWMMTNVGRPQWDWSLWVNYNKARFTFRDPSKVLLFKLTWAGNTPGL